MKPAPFHFISPSTLTEALDIMSQYGADAKLLAGGQSLIPVMNFRLAHPSVIVDLNKVGELGQLQATHSGGLRIGAMVRQSQLEHSDAVTNHIPLIHETMPHIAHSQIRSRGTIGGSLAHADPAAELPVVMVALQAQFLLRKMGRERWVNAENFFQSLFTTALEPDEILIEIDIPSLPRRIGYSFMEFARRHGDYAQAGVAAIVRLDESGYCRQARLVFLNVGEIPMVAGQAATALVGHIPSPNLITSVAMDAARNEIEPTGDIHATADYRRHLAFVLGKRAIEKAVSRARIGLSHE
jgi:CO/xanthine dehydrogenase FAD-binding subunit